MIYALASGRSLFGRLLPHCKPKNLNTLRKLALSLIKQYKTNSNSKRPLSQIMFNCPLYPSAICNIHRKLISLLHFSREWTKCKCYGIIKVSKVRGERRKGCVLSINRYKITKVGIVESTLARIEG